MMKAKVHLSFMYLRRGEFLSTLRNSASTVPVAYGQAGECVRTYAGLGPPRLVFVQIRRKDGRCAT